MFPYYVLLLIIYAMFCRPVLGARQQDDPRAKSLRTIVQHAESAGYEVSRARVFGDPICYTWIPNST